MTLRTEVFNAADLKPLDEKDYCILASGGPLLKIESIEGDTVFCVWSTPDEYGKLVIRREAFNKEVLRRLVPFEEK